jgi:ABC-type dipeptide/oligopeptide/nickel transport system permease subunit
LGGNQEMNWEKATDSVFPYIFSVLTSSAALSLLVGPIAGLLAGGLLGMIIGRVLSVLTGLVHKPEYKPPTTDIWKNYPKWLKVVLIPFYFGYVWFLFLKNLLRPAVKYIIAILLAYVLIYWLFYVLKLHRYLFD